MTNPNQSPRPGATRVAAVTGGAQGIGLAIAKDLYKAGYCVAIGDLDAAAATSAAEALGPRAGGFALDVSKSESFEKFLADSAAHFSDIDVLVNNAGVMWVGRFDEEPERALRSQLEVNLMGTIHGVKLAAPAMRKRGRGQIINIASAASLLTTPGEATYAATKHGVFGYLKAVREELKSSGVIINVIMPAVVDTKLAVGTSTGVAKILQPEDVAQAVMSVIGRSKFEVTIPGYVAPLNRFINILPRPVREWVFGAMVPNQVKDTDASARVEYEAQFKKDDNK
ncbi:MAG TPA: SDR family oxidoreductase [Aeromicrobium sp.]|nr:SDR family oxidoreductase [Aeromicrobium sp.]